MFKLRNIVIILVFIQISFGYFCTRSDFIHIHTNALRHLQDALVVFYFFWEQNTVQSPKLRFVVSF